MERLNSEDILMVTVVDKQRWQRKDNTSNIVIYIILDSSVNYAFLFPKCKMNCTYGTKDPLNSYLSHASRHVQEQWWRRQLEETRARKRPGFVWAFATANVASHSWFEKADRSWSSWLEIIQASEPFQYYVGFCKGKCSQSFPIWESGNRSCSPCFEICWSSGSIKHCLGICNGKHTPISFFLRRWQQKSLDVTWCHFVLMLYIIWAYSKAHKPHPSMFAKVAT